MNQTGKSVLQLYKCSIVLKCFYSSFQNSSNLHTCNLCITCCFFLFLQKLTCRKDKTIIRLVNIDHLYFDILEKIIFQILNIGKGQLRSRNKSAKSFYHYNYATVDNTFNFNRKNRFLIHIILDSVPWIRIIEMIFIVCHCFCYFICL